MGFGNLQNPPLAPGFPRGTIDKSATALVA